MAGVSCYCTVLFCYATPLCLRMWSCWLDTSQSRLTRWLAAAEGTAVTLARRFSEGKEGREGCVSVPNWDVNSIPQYHSPATFLGVPHRYCYYNYTFLALQDKVVWTCRTSTHFNHDYYYTVPMATALTMSLSLCSFSSRPDVSDFLGE